MTIQAFIVAKRDLVAELCLSSHVRRLDVFGSAVREDFSLDSSDIDMLVEFDSMEPSDYADAYFQLKDGLERLFHRSIDLLTVNSLQNPYLRAQVDAEREVLYSA